MKNPYILAACAAFLVSSSIAFASGEKIECSNGTVTYQVEHSYVWWWGHYYQLVSLTKNGQAKNFGHAPGMIPNNCRARGKQENGSFELLCAVSSDGPRWFDESEINLVFNTQLQLSENKDGSISGLRMNGESTVSYTTFFGKKRVFSDLSCRLL